MPESDDPGVFAIAGDVTDPATAERLICGALDRYGRVDTLVNNAGVFISKPFTEYTSEDYGRVVGVNLSGFFTLTQRAVSEMVRLGRGHIVNITTTLVEHADARVSVRAHRADQGRAVCGDEITRDRVRLSRDPGQRRVPGVVQTSESDASVYDTLAAFHPLGRVGHVRDVVDAVLFLESAPFVTGEILHVDGGQSAGH